MGSTHFSVEFRAEISRTRVLCRPTSTDHICVIPTSYFTHTPAISMNQFPVGIFGKQQISSPSAIDCFSTRISWPTDTQLTLWAVKDLQSSRSVLHCRTPSSCNSTKIVFIPVTFLPATQTAATPKICLGLCQRSSLFWDGTQRRLVFCPETSVINYRSTLRNIPEERGSWLHREGSPQFRVVCGCCAAGGVQLYSTVITVAHCRAGRGTKHLSMIRDPVKIQKPG